MSARAHRIASPRPRPLATDETPWHGALAFPSPLSEHYNCTWRDTMVGQHDPSIGCHAASIEHDGRTRGFAGGYEQNYARSRPEREHLTTSSPHTHTPYTRTHTQLLGTHSCKAHETLHALLRSLLAHRRSYPCLVPCKCACMLARPWLGDVSCAVPAARPGPVPGPTSGEVSGEASAQSRASTCRQPHIQLYAAHRAHIWPPTSHDEPRPTSEHKLRAYS